jgi:acetolactate decarboxylase
MNKSILTLVFIFSTFFFGIASNLYQAGTINALMKGLYQGTITIKEVKEDGTMGLGCGVGLGELIGYEKNYYIADGFGYTKLLQGDQETPFINYVKFKSEISYTVTDIKNIKELKKKIDKKLISDNIFYAIKIQGEFIEIKARSENIAKPPYQPLIKWLKNHEHRFTIKNTTATIVAFKCPAFIKGIGVPGYHLHFISEDKKRGGHVFGLKIKKAKIEIQPLYNFNLKLPKTKEYLSKDMSYTAKAHTQLKKIESGK